MQIAMELWTNDEELAYDMKNEFDSAAIVCSFLFVFFLNII